MFVYVTIYNVKNTLHISSINTIHMNSGITSGLVLDGELLYTKILEVNLFAFAYKLFHRDFSPINGTLHWYSFFFPALYIFRVLDTSIVL